MAQAIKCDKCGNLDDKPARSNYYKEARVTITWMDDLCRDCKARALITMLNQFSEELEWKKEDFT